MDFFFMNEVKEQVLFRDNHSEHIFWIEGVSDFMIKVNTALW
ncbi:Uncharacterised protein [Streptococcus pneumoniae]|nr:hypothetical protein HMPREF0837_10925 [Streptococcus pneumoniae TCH8431/19A]AFS42729.1 hypothetical protein HMPREF1038_00658 [Streptococcus pneumoniae gamPNI0373]ELU56472.1 hypothetical protein PCS8203_01239 [Streptococcus pneumoniae PCS8203]ELU60515.1 hypothetical protein PCS8106_00207 [Streptococcus pneumoniae PCS8106]ELU61052.1 hypothetical protein PCS125219_00281 [Streptococcus pneumoniae PCS125219]ELU63036.1 hypothetical protein PCS70012_01257 [Streptococcus pneumoniae PCS70012]ELU643